MSIFVHIVVPMTVFCMIIFCFGGFLFDGIPLAQRVRHSAQEWKDLLVQGDFR